MKVKDIRKAIENLTDDAEVLLSINGSPENMFETTYKTYRSKGETKQYALYVWGDKYQTREAWHAYQAKDDRYGGSVLLITIGKLSY